LEGEEGMLDTPEPPPKKPKGPIEREVSCLRAALGIIAWNDHVGTNALSNKKDENAFMVSFWFSHFVGQSELGVVELMWGSFDLHPLTSINCH
jgi:hypothetical protein